MRTNVKKDKVLQIVAILSAVLCVLAAIAGIMVQVFLGNNYNATKIEKLNVSSFEEIKDKEGMLYNDHITLNEDITITDSKFSFASTDKPFEGIFDGNGKTIYLDFNQVESNNSLFKNISKDGLIKNTRFVFKNEITIFTNSYGALCYENKGDINNCKVEFENLIIKNEGIYAPVSVINKGKIENVISKGKITGNLDYTASLENNLFIGYISVYNYGTIKGSIADVDYEGLNSTNLESILKGQSRNNSIGAIKVENIGKDALLVSNGIIIKPQDYVLDSAVDKNESISITYNDRNKFFTENLIYIKLGFSNKLWTIDSNDLKLIIRVEEK